MDQLDLTHTYCLQNMLYMRAVVLVLVVEQLVVCCVISSVASIQMFTFSFACGFVFREKCRLRQLISLW